MQALTRKQQVQALEMGIGLARQGRCRGLVEAAHALLDLSGGDEAGPLEGEAEHLEVRNVESPPELGRPGAKLPGLPTVAAHAGDVALVEGKPTMVGSGVQRLQQAPRPPQPTARHRQRPWKSR